MITSLLDEFKGQYISPRAIEAMFGLLLVTMGLWGWYFDWFNTYLVALRDLAPYGWVIFLVVTIYGALQYSAAKYEVPKARPLFCIVSMFVFSFLLSAMVTERGPLGAHTPGFGFCIAAHFWCWMRHAGYWGGGSD